MWSSGDSSKTCDSGVVRHTARGREIRSGFCSWCFEWSDFERIERCYFQRDTYRCSLCGHLTAVCRAPGCCDMARSGKRHNDDFCLAHAGEISSFNNLHRRIDDLCDYSLLYHGDTLNYRKLCRIAALSIGGAVAVAPIAFLAAPSVEGALTAALARLAGRSTVAKGLARLGLTLIEAGEASSAANVAVMTTLGATTGGILSGVIANAYIGDVQGFRITRFKDGCDPAIVVINGFLTQDRKRPEDVWKPMLSRFYPKNAWHLVEWESKRLKDLGRMTFASGSNEVVRAALLRSLQRESARALRPRLHPLSSVFTFMGLATNSWHVAMVKSAQTGVILADILARVNPERTYTLIGHSLGARVIFHALRTLRGSERKNIQDVHLLGAAIGIRPEDDWKLLADSIRGSVHNYYSSNDLILQVLYSAGQFFLASPAAGCRAIEPAPDTVFNHNVNAWVFRHGDFKRKSVDFWIP